MFSRLPARPRRARHGRDVSTRDVSSGATANGGISPSRSSKSGKSRSRSPPRFRPGSHPVRLSAPPGKSATSSAPARRRGESPRRRGASSGRAKAPRPRSTGTAQSPIILARRCTSSADRSHFQPSASSRPEEGSRPGRRLAAAGRRDTILPPGEVRGRRSAGGGVPRGILRMVRNQTQAKEENRQQQETTH